MRSTPLRTSVDQVDQPFCLVAGFRAQHRHIAQNDRVEGRGDLQVVAGPERLRAQLVE
jgi:hypothetical protein